MLIENLDPVVIDVETAFVYGKLAEEIYIEIPQGYREVFTAKAINSLLLK